MKTGPNSPKKKVVINTLSSQQPSTSNHLDFQANVPTQNSFEPLIIEMNPISSTPESKSPQDEKPPPIIVEQVINFSKLTQLLLRHIEKDNFITKTIPNRVNKNIVDVVIKLKLIDDYRKLNHILKENGARYHTYQLKQDKAFRVVLRHLHPSTPTDLIKEDLEVLGFSVRNITNALHPASKAPLPLFFVDLNPSPKNKEIFSIEAIAHTHIKVEEPRKRKDIVQCFRCQAYGHTKGYCQRAPRCVKCGEEHLTAECKLPRNSGHAKCALCQGNHPASYRGCITHRELETRISRKVQPQTSYSAAASAAIPSAAPASTPAFAPADFPPLLDTVQPTHSAQQHHQATSRGHSIPMPTYIPPPPPSSDMTSLLSNFLSDLKNIITPLINVLTTVMTQLIPALVKK